MQVLELPLLLFLMEWLLLSTRQLFLSVAGAQLMLGKFYYNCHSELNFLIRNAPHSLFRISTKYVDTIILVVILMDNG